MLINTISWPVFVSTAVCSSAQSSDVVRLALVHRATQPGGGDAFAAAASAGEADGAGVACAGGAALLALGACWAWIGPESPNINATAIANFTEMFTAPAPK